MSVYTETAAAVLAAVEAHPVISRISVGRDVVTIEGNFDAGDRNAYIACDSDGYSILSKLPMIYPGSTWGTDGATVGGAAGLAGGYYRLSKSGVGKRYLNAIRKGLAR